MNKFNVGDTVKYNGEIQFLADFFSSMGRTLKVTEVVPDNTAVGNGETNVSGQYLYKVKANTGTQYIFLENQLMPGE